jgi:hypothetical protein
MLKHWVFRGPRTGISNEFLAGAGTDIAGLGTTL